jgi:hypothetical protein
VTKKRADDGTPLWTCKHCNQDKKREDMYVHGKSDNVCKACNDGGTKPGDLKISWAIANMAPKDKKVSKDRAIWKWVKPFLCYYRMAENRRKFNDTSHRKRILVALFNRKRKFPDSVHEPILRAMREFELGPRVLLWLALRPGVFDKQELRLLAVEAAEQAVQFSGVGNDYPVVYNVLTALHQFTDEGNVQALQLSREQIYGVQKALLEEEYVKPQVHTSAQSVASACARDSGDAAVLTLSNAHETLEHEGLDADAVIRIFADSVRSIARVALSRYELPDVPHWRGLEEV